MTESEDKDLPLMANVTEILVTHYSLDFACNFKDKHFSCSATIFLKPVPSEKENKCLCSKDHTRNKFECLNNRNANNAAEPNDCILNTKERTEKDLSHINCRSVEFDCSWFEDQSSKEPEHLDDRNTVMDNNPKTDNQSFFNEDQIIREPGCINYQKSNSKSQTKDLYLKSEEEITKFGCIAHINPNEHCYRKAIHTDKSIHISSLNKDNTETDDQSFCPEGQPSEELGHSKEENANSSLEIDDVCLYSKYQTNEPDHNTNKQLPNSAEDTGFMVLLDCHQIIVKEVVDVATQQKLQFLVSPWALKVWRGSRTCRFCFPRVIWITYETLPSCPSLLWVKDQRERPAVFTFGAYVNNRSLLPCQEPPIAMATWEAVVTVTDSATVLMSGDEEPSVTIKEGGLKQYNFHCKKPLPMSTLCLAVGFWEEYAIHSDLQLHCKCRLFACPNMLDKSIKELTEYIPQCIAEAENILGPYPFPRIDFLFVPSTFGSLGMASPNVVFLSQSLLSGGSMLSRVSHEVSHGWFGLSLGALDWTEEWISEGFATFMEDVLHTRVAKMSTSDANDFLELKTFLRKQILTYEIENTKQELQVLRPSFGNTSTHIIDGVNATMLKNGQNPEKNFMQVHYIKGYFLLNYLSNIVGLDCFLHGLQKYVEIFEGRLVTSQEFFAFLFDTCPELKRNLTIESIYENWLHNPGMPSEIENFKPSCSNKLFLQVFDEIGKWKKLNASFSKRKAKRKKLDTGHFSTLIPEQTILLLEKLLEEERLSDHTLTSLEKVLHLKDANAEVQHRWFELVVKYRLKSEYSALKDFLTNHLALGVYLYGEAIHSGNAELKRLAEERFLSLKCEMEPNYRDTIQGMLNRENTELDSSPQE